MKNFWKNNSLSIVMFLLFFIFLTAQSVTGHRANNQELEDHGQPTQSYISYIGSGDFVEGVFENWESEFLQMGSYVFLTVFLRQRGSAESKKIEGEEAVDRDPKKSVSKDAPGPVKQGGLALKLYKNSLSIAFILLFLMSFALHGIGGAAKACEEEKFHGQPCESTVSFMSTSEFWYQSFQNWQSEYLAVFAIVILSVYLRQQGSPESKPVNTPHYETGN